MKYDGPVKIDTGLYWGWADRPVDFLSRQLLGVTWSDEIVYATIARNLVMEQSLNTNYYRTDSIIRRGFPSRDVHVPGHMLVIALSFVVFGFSDTAAILPSQASYVVAGLIVFVVGQRLFSRRAA